MKVLKKHVEMGELKFDIGVDRVIVADVFDHFPEQLAAMLDIYGSGDEDIVSMAKGKRLKQFILFNERKDEIIKYALPQMLEKANGDGEPVDYEKKSSEIISFAEENEVNEFFDGVWEMIVSGFTIRERDKKKKVSFSIK